jgi:hypothetical protein
MLFLRKGWIESRLPGRQKLTILLEYHILKAEEFNSLAKTPDYAHTRVTGGLASSMAALFQVPVVQMIDDGLLFCSQDPLKDAEDLEVTVVVPKWKTRLRLLGKLSSIRLDEEMKEVVSTASLKLTAAHQADLKRLTDAIEKSKD